MESVKNHASNKLGSEYFWDNRLSSEKHTQVGKEKNMANPENMWQCQGATCGYIYNPDKGDKKGNIPKGTPFEDLPDDWKCPLCGSSKKMFRPLAGPGSVAAEGD